ncbi:MAG: type II toxin-antitoxin system VapC family toxin [Candidatus Sulfotelmatobacter sp.]|jgi:predicted nucleic acid-binding protein
MRTALDTNILSPVLSGAPESEQIVAQLLTVRSEGALVISGPVFVELSAIPAINFERTEETLREISVAIDFDLGEDVWRLAANRFSAYANRRRLSGGGQTKRLLADFVIAAHALLQADRLMTRDASRYRQDFPQLRLI